MSRSAVQCTKIFGGGIFIEIFERAGSADFGHNSQPAAVVANDAARFPAAVSWLVPGNFVGVHSASGDGFNFVVCLSSWVQSNAGREFPVHFMAGLRNVSVVFHKREHFERDKFGSREQLPGEKNRIPRRTFANRQDNVGAGRARFFCSGIIFNVRAVRLSGVALQFADFVLFFCNDMFDAGDFVADECADGIPARRWAIYGDVVAVWILGDADFLESENDTGAIPVLAEAESGVLFG